MLPPAGEVWTIFWLACNPSQLSDSQPKFEVQCIYCVDTACKSTRHLTIHKQICISLCEEYIRNFESFLSVPSSLRLAYIRNFESFLSVPSSLLLASLYPVRARTPSKFYFSVVKGFQCSPLFQWTERGYLMVLRVCYSVLWFLLCVLFWETASWIWMSVFYSS